VTTILPLKIEGASVRRRGKRLVGPVDLTIEGDGATIVIGPNGAGKTSLLRLMHGLERPAEGRVSWNAPAKEVRMRQAFVFQMPIMMRRTVLDCIAYPLTTHGTSLRLARVEAARAAVEVGLGDALEQRARSLSGGEQQKLALARALIRSPEVLFLDEPCASLDGRSMREIEEVLTRARDKGTRIVMSTHDMGQARRLADEIVFLARGALVEAGPADRFFTSPGTAEGQAFLNGDIIE